MRIGVLALQGDFIEHIRVLKKLKVRAMAVRLPQQILRLDGLIIPGGESTTIGKLAVHYKLVDPIKKMIKQKKPVWGTCAGMIMLANKIKEGANNQPLIGGMDITVSRNAFGRQIDSFETDLTIKGIQNEHKSFPAIFIRAPLIQKVGKGVDVLARLSDGTIVAARQNNLLATSFHPELTDDTRLHEYFLKKT